MRFGVDVKVRLREARAPSGARPRRDDLLQRFAGNVGPCSASRSPADQWSNKLARSAGWTRGDSIGVPVVDLQHNRLQTEASRGSRSGFWRRFRPLEHVDETWQEFNKRTRPRAVDVAAVDGVNAICVLVPASLEATGR